MQKLMMFGQGKISIVHIGGSHVQGDGMSAMPRKMFSETAENLGAERGAFFPLSVARTNGSPNLATSYTGQWDMCRNSAGQPDRPMGILGMDVYTTDPYATISFDLNPTGTKWSFTRMRLLATMNDSVTTPLLAVDGDTIEGVKDGHSYVFECDEGTTAGTLLFRHRFFTGYGSVPEICVMGFIPENDHPGLTYHSLGVNGAALWSWMRCTEFDRQIEYLKPDLVILGVGINDANVPCSKFDVDRFKEQYRSLLDKIYKVSPECAVVFITNNDCVLNLGRRRNKPINQNTPRVEQAMFELANEQGAAVWNQYRIMGGYGSASAWVNAGLMRGDKIHFTAAGYNILGEMLYHSIMETGESWNY